MQPRLATTLGALTLVVVQPSLAVSQCPGYAPPPPPPSDSGGSGGGGGPAAGGGSGGPASGGPSSPAPSGPSQPRPGYGGPAGGPSSPPGGPAAPGGGGPGSGWTPPSTPPAPAGNPLGPEVTPDRGLVLPLSPRELDLYGAVTDPTDWQLWWELNKDRFLARERFGTGSVLTSSDDFYLGAGQVDRSVEVDAAARAVAADAIAHILEHGGPRAHMDAALLAAIGARDRDTQRQLRFVAELLLDEGDEHCAATAVFALGATGDPAHLALLTSLARDDEAGRALRRGVVLDTRIRAFAATGLGLAAGSLNNLTARRNAVETLARIVDDKGSARALRCAALVGLGLVPLPVETDSSVCYCGECARENPNASFQAQVSFLLEHVIADRDYDPLARAEAITALGRLVGARLNTVPDDIKRGVVGTLHRVLDERSRQTQVVRQSAILALGLIGDADASHEDNWVRWTLRRAARSGKDFERRFALISLALTASRQGQGSEPWAATDEVRAELLQHLAQGLGGLRPWAALSLGVLEHDLRRAGHAPSVSVDTALEAQLRRARRSERGAIALALGLAGASERSTTLTDVLEHERDAASQSYAALALGLAGVGDAKGALGEVMLADDAHPLLRLRSGIALGLLGSEEVVPRLVDSFERPMSEVHLHSTIAALAQVGDPRAIDPLAALVVDETKNPSERVREEALRALGRLIEPRTLAWRAVLANGANYHARDREAPGSVGSVLLELR